ncbi:MAG: C1 family peptidase [Bizionia sp.]|nr:C1 family peptidase [Bizionia sp.]
MIKEKSGAALSKSRVFGLGVIHFNEMLFRNVISYTILQYKFEQEGVSTGGGVEMRDIINKTNPFIENHQQFFEKFLKKHPYSIENHHSLTTNSKNYIEDFKLDLEQFITNDENNLGETKAILGNLLGENDSNLEGIDWSGNRLNVEDLEYDIISYFNKYLNDTQQVKFEEQKELKSKITQLSQSIKKGEASIKKLIDQSEEIHRELKISFEDGIISLNGKRMNASGYIPSPVKPSDEVYSFQNKILPNAVDLGRYFSKVKDQGQISSCTVFPIAAVYEFYAYRNNKEVDISELFIYYNARDIKGETDLDEGVTLWSALQAVIEKGACYSKSHPYNIDEIKNKPSDAAYNEAQRQVVNKASRIKIEKKDFKQAIAKGIPVIIGLKIYKSFFINNASGIIEYPSENEISNNSYGTQTLLIVGYNDDDKLFKIRNSWGESFGDKGYCYAPYDYIANQEFCLEAFVITDIMDLSFEEFDGHNEENFSFLTDSVKRKKIIREYDLRGNKKKIEIVKNNYDELAFKNEKNATRIKDPMFRKRIFEDKLKEELGKTPSVSKPSNTSGYKKSLTSLLIIGLGTLVILTSFFLMSLISLIGTLVGGVLGVVLIVMGVLKFNKNGENKDMAVIASVNNFGDRDKYAFEVADNLFEMFDDLNQDLIKRYKAISSYYLKVKNWQIESEKELSEIDYKSPNFVVNVIKKAPLLNYIKKEKLLFMQNLPNLSNVFNKDFDPKKDNVDEVFESLKSSYIRDIDENIEGVLDISIVDYLQEEKVYPFFEPAPKLSNTINNLQKLSSPFCNIKQTLSPSQVQNYVIHETIVNDKDKKSKEFKKHRDANIAPIITYRDNNRKKYVAIQVTALDSIKDLVSYNKH